MRQRQKSASLDNNRPEEWSAGMDGARGGWIVACWSVQSGNLIIRRIESPEEIDSLPEQPYMVCIDMPIGLADAAIPGGRECDRLARAMLGPGRGASVFSPPTRAALAAQDYGTANILNRRSSPHSIGLSKQTFNLFPALRQVDRFVTPERQETLKETHPELVFRRLNHGQPVQAPKRTLEGRDVRRALLVERAGVRADVVTEALAQGRGLKAAPDDILDAVALAAAARDIVLGRATRLPEAPPRDSRGLRMEIWG